MNKRTWLGSTVAAIVLFIAVFIAFGRGALFVVTTLVSGSTVDIGSSNVELLWNEYHLPHSEGEPVFIGKLLVSSALIEVSSTDQPESALITMHRERCKVISCRGFQFLDHQTGSKIDYLFTSQNGDQYRTVFMFLRRSSTTVEYRGLAGSWPDLERTYYRLAEQL